MNDFIVTNVNVIVNLLSKHCAEIILRLYILLRFYSSYYSSYISTAWSAYKGVGGGGGRRIFAGATQKKPHIYIYISKLQRKSWGQHSNEGKRGKGDNVPAVKRPNYIYLQEDKPSK